VFKKRKRSTKESGLPRKKRGGKKENMLLPRVKQAARRLRGSVLSSGEAGAGRGICMKVKPLRGGT